MWVLQVLSAYLMLTFGLATLVLPIAGWSEPELGPGYSIGLAIVYAAFAWLSYKGFAAARSIRKDLAAASA